jgi:AraC-like DNA-binding protein
MTISRAPSSAWPNGCGSDSGEHHEKVNIQSPVAQRLQTGPAGFPSSGDVAARHSTHRSHDGPRASWATPPAANNAVARDAQRTTEGHRFTAPPRHKTTRHGTISMVTSRPSAAQRLDDLARLRRVRDRIDREYAQPLDVEALARGAHMSAGHLSREFKLAYGESPYGYLMTRRIERAMALLRRGDLSVTEVCFAVGCSSLGTFSTRFTELVGMPPSVYRSQAARASAGLPPCVAKQVTRPIRNREVRVAEPI